MKKIRSILCINLALLFIVCSAFGSVYTYLDPDHGSISLQLSFVPDGVYLYADTNDLYKGNYTTPNDSYNFSEPFDERNREYVVISIWELTNRGPVLFYSDDRSDFTISGGHLKVQEHQNHVNLEGLLTPTVWLEVLDQFLVYHSYSRRKQTYLDIFEKIMLSPAGFTELDGNIDGIFEMEKSWFTSFLSNISGNTYEEKIANLNSALSTDFSGELLAHDWFERGRNIYDFVETLRNLQEIEKSLGGVGLFFDGLGKVVDIFENTNDAAKKQKVIALLCMARNLKNVENLCYAFKEASIGNSDPAYSDAWNEFESAYCEDGGYIQLHRDISEQIKKDLLIDNSVEALGVLVGAGVTKYLTSKGLLGATKLGTLKAALVLWAAGEVWEGVKDLTDLDNRMLRDALVSHIFNTLSEKITEKENSGFRYLGHARDILSLKRLQSSLMIYIWSDFKIFMEENDSFDVFSGPMGWATYLGIGWSGARDSINQNYLDTIETSNLMYLPDTILSDISNLVQLSPAVEPIPIALLNDYSFSVNVGATVNFDGSASHDPSGKDIFPIWSLSVPVGSSTAFSSSNSLLNSISPDKPGIYEVTLVVSNGEQVSEPASATVFASPEPVHGHDLELNSCDGPSSIRPGGTYNFDITVCNKGENAENISARLTVNGSSVSNGTSQASLGSIPIPTGSSNSFCKSFENVLSYTMPSNLSEGYYNFTISIQGDIGDQNWSDNVRSLNVRYGDPVPVYSTAFQQKGHAVPYDPDLEITQYSDVPFDGGFGKITVETPYAVYTIWQADWLGSSGNYYTYFFVQSNKGYTEFDEKVYENDVEVFDDGRLLIGAENLDFDYSWIVVGWPADDKVSIEPETAMVEVGQEFSFSIFMPEKGGCCFSDLHDWHAYNPASNRRFNMDDDDFRTVIEADGLRVDHGYDLTVKPLQAGTHDFVAEIVGDNGTNFFVIGQIKATEPIVDTDNDGIVDDLDAFPNDPAASIDSDNDAFPDAWNPGMTEADSTTGLTLDLAPHDPHASVDTDDDGILDYYDAFPNDPSEQYDSDGDGAGDNSDIAPNDPSRSTNSAPELGDISYVSLIAGNTCTIDLMVSDAENDDLFLQLTNAPPFVYLSGIKINIAPAEKDQGTFTITVTVTDQFNASNSKSFALEVTPRPQPGDPDYDSDNDGLPNALEEKICTDPYDCDSDNDGISDGDEDADHDGVLGFTDNENHPCNPDTDGDGYNDGLERLVGTSPLNKFLYPFVVCIGDCNEMCDDCGNNIKDSLDLIYQNGEKNYLRVHGDTISDGNIVLTTDMLMGIESGTIILGNDSIDQNNNVFPSSLENSRILLYVDYSQTVTSWNINQIQTEYPDAAIEGEYVIFQKDFSEYGVSSTNSNFQYDEIPAGVSLIFAVGENNQIYIGTKSTSPWSLGLIASMTNLGLPWESLSLTPDECQLLFDNNIKPGLEPSVKLTTLFSIQLNEYKKWVEKGYVSSPLSKTDQILLPKARINNATGSRLVSVFAASRAHWGEITPSYNVERIDAWWPKGSADDTGTTIWSFDVGLSSLYSDGYSEVYVYGDNGTTQTVFWDSAVKLSHSNYGGILRREFLSSVPMTTISLEHANVWSGNYNYISFTLPTDEIELSNMVENPAVGEPPFPRKIVFPKGWSE